MSLVRATEANIGTGSTQLASASGLTKVSAGSSRQRRTSSWAESIRSRMVISLTGSSSRAMVTALAELPSLTVLRRLIGMLNRNCSADLPCRSW